MRKLFKLSPIQRESLLSQSKPSLRKRKKHPYTCIDKLSSRKTSRTFLNQTKEKKRERENERETRPRMSVFKWDEYRRKTMSCIVYVRLIFFTASREVGNWDIKIGSPYSNGTIFFSGGWRHFRNYHILTIAGLHIVKKRQVEGERRARIYTLKREQRPESHGRMRVLCMGCNKQNKNF